MPTHRPSVWGPRRVKGFATDASTPIEDDPHQRQYVSLLASLALHALLLFMGDPRTPPQEEPQALEVALNPMGAGALRKRGGRADAARPHVGTAPKAGRVAAPGRERHRAPKPCPRSSQPRPPPPRPPPGLR